MVENRKRNGPKGDIRGSQKNIQADNSAAQAAMSTTAESFDQIEHSFDSSLYLPSARRMIACDRHTVYDVNTNLSYFCDFDKQPLMNGFAALAEIGWTVRCHPAMSLALDGEGAKGMERITITIDDELLAAIDSLIDKRGYPSRSEAIRELVRDAATQDLMSRGTAPCVAALSYVYDHTARDLSQRLVNAQHDHHDLSIATTHVHFDHDHCLEVAILRGSSGAIQKLADNLTAQRGVRHANLNIIPLKPPGKPHQHGPGGVPHAH